MWKLVACQHAVIEKASVWNNSSCCGYKACSSSSSGSVKVADGAERMWNFSPGEDESFQRNPERVHAFPPFDHSRSLNFCWLQLHLHKRLLILAWQGKSIYFIKPSPGGKTESHRPVLSFIVNYYLKCLLTWTKMASLWCQQVCVICHPQPPTAIRQTLVTSHLRLCTRNKLNDALHKSLPMSTTFNTH